MAAKKYPFESSGLREDGKMLWRRITGRGMVTREGTLTVMRGFSLPNHIVKIPFTKIKYEAGVRVYYFELRFSEAPDVIQGYINREKTINRIKKGERCGILVCPETLWVKRIWPLDRKLKLHQF